MKIQQYSLYAAETEAPTGPVFEDLDQLEAWVRSEMLDAWWWHERYPRVRGIRVPRVRRNDSVGGWREEDGLGTIEMGRPHWCAKYVCHEVAHVTSRAEAGSTSHDPVFARHYLELVYLTIGSDAYLDLRRRFEEGGIEFG